MRSAWTTYLGMYFTLEFAFDQDGKGNNALREFLGDANPFIWDDIGSADPAIWAEFESGFSTRFREKEASDADTLVFVQEFLSEKSAYYSELFTNDNEVFFKDLFDNETTLVEWTRVLDDLERQEAKRVGG